MKAVLILTLMLLMVHMGCKDGWNPPTESRIPDYRDINLPSPNYCINNFKACIQVTFGNGDPCTTAYARSFNMRMADHADSNGVMKFQDTMPCDDPELYGDTFLCTIWNDATRSYKNRVWEGEVELIKNSNTYPEPQVIVIPN